MKLAIIDWVDSERSTEWRSIENMPTPNLSCRSVGWIARKKKRYLFVVPHISSDRYQSVGGMFIPTCAVTKITYLKGG